MTTYYYDEEARALIAVNEETSEVRLLEALRLEVEDIELPTRETKSPKISRRKGAGCPDCGSPSRHRRECPRAGKGAVAKPKKSGNSNWKKLGEDATPSAAISRMQFGRVKIAISHNIPHETIANNLGVSESEVSKASEAEAYDDYLKL